MTTGSCGRSGARTPLVLVGVERQPGAFHQPERLVFLPHHGLLGFLLFLLIVGEIHAVHEHGPQNQERQQHGINGPSAHSGDAGLGVELQPVGRGITAHRASLAASNVSDALSESLPPRPFSSVVALRPASGRPEGR